MTNNFLVTPKSSRQGSPPARLPFLENASKFDKGKENLDFTDEFIV